MRLTQFVRSAFTCCLSCSNADRSRHRDGQAVSGNGSRLAARLALFSDFTLEQRVPVEHPFTHTHPLRIVNVALVLGKAQRDPIPRRRRNPNQSD
jgi:hypothetical protein